MGVMIPDAIRGSRDRMGVVATQIIRGLRWMYINFIYVKYCDKFKTSRIIMSIQDYGHASQFGASGGVCKL